MKTYVLSLMIIAALTAPSSRASTSIIWHNSEGAELRDITGTPLKDWISGKEYSGAIVRLGYYTLATATDPFAGEWVYISDSYMSIGGKGPGSEAPGRFYYKLSIPDKMFDITVGMPLAMRFYDSASIETSTYFNAVTSATGEWNWVESPDSGVRINVVLEPTSSLIWQDGSDSAFRTTIPVPEPATALLLVIAGTGACLFRRR